MNCRNTRSLPSCAKQQQEFTTSVTFKQGRRQGNSLGGGKGTSGVQGAAPPAGVQGAEPLGGGEGAKPPEAETFLVLKSW